MTLSFCNSLWRRLKENISYYMLCYFFDSLTCLRVHKDIRFGSSYSLSISFHDGKICANVRRNIDLIYYQEITAFYAKPSFSGIFIAARDIYNIDKIISQCWTERGSNIVASTFNYNQIEIIVFSFHLLYYRNIH